MGSTAELGLRIFLEDSASAGFGSLLGVLSLFGSRIGGLNGLWQSLSTVQKGAAVTAVGAGLAFAGFAEATKSALGAGADLQDTLIQVKIAVKGAGDNMQATQDDLVGLANTSKYTTKEIGDGFIQLGEHGFTFEDIVKNHMGTALVNLAESINSDVQPAAYLLSSTMQTFGANANEASKYADELTGMFYNGIPNVNDMRQALAQVAGQAHLSGWSFQDLATALDILVRHGMPASQAATSLRYALTDLQSPVPHVLDDMASLGLVIFNKTAPALEQLQAKMIAAGATAKSVQWDGTAKGLQAIYTAANKLPGLHIDKSFNAWAVGSGIMSSKLVDAQGNLKSFKDIVQQVGDALKNSSANKDAVNKLMTDLMGGTRSGRAGSILFGNTDQILADIQKIEPAVSQTGQAAKDAADRMSSWNSIVKMLSTSFTDLQAVIGLQLIGILTPLLSGFNGFLSYLSVGNTAFAQFAARFLLVGTVLSGVLLVVAAGTLIFGALFSTVGMIGMAIGGVVVAIGAGAALIASNWDKIAGAFRTVQPLLSPISDAFKDVSKAIGTQLSGTLKDMPGLLGQFGAAFNNLRPVLLFLVGLVGVVLVVAITVAIRVIGGLVQGLILIFGGLVRVFVGLEQVFSGVWSILVGLFTLNGAKIQQGWSQLWQGIRNILVGAGGMILGVVIGIFGAVIGLVAGFVNGVIGYFSHLADVLVGHSIVPDMLRNIQNWFHNILSQIASFVLGWVAQQVASFTLFASQVYNAVMAGFNNVRNYANSSMIQIANYILSGANNAANWFRNGLNQLGGIATGAMGAAQGAVSGGINGVVGVMSSLPGRIAGILGGLGSMMYSSGSSMVQMMASGIMASIGSVVAAASAVASAVAAKLEHHSPTKEGPLSKGDQFMPNMMKMYAAGILSSIPLVANAANQAAGAIAAPFSSPASSRLALSASSATGVHGAHGQHINHIHIYMDSKEIAQAQLDDMHTVMAMNGLTRIHYK